MNNITLYEHKVSNKNNFSNLERFTCENLKEILHVRDSITNVRDVYTSLQMNMDQQFETTNYAWLKLCLHNI